MGVLCPQTGPALQRHIMRAQLETANYQQPASPGACARGPTLAPQGHPPHTVRPRHMLATTPSLRSVDLLMYTSTALERHLRPVRLDIVHANPRVGCRGRPTPPKAVRTYALQPHLLGPPLGL